MKLTHTRTLVAALGLSLLAHGAWAQPAATAAPAAAQQSTIPVAPATPATPVTTQAAPTSSAMPGHGPQTDKKATHQNHQAIAEKLGLTPAQKIQFDDAQAARKAIRQAKQASKVERQKVMSAQLNQEQMDPRALIDFNKQSQAAMQAKRAVAEQKWLAFWDGLTAEQRKTFTAYMKAKQQNHAQKQHGQPRS